MVNLKSNEHTTKHINSAQEETRFNSSTISNVYNLSKFANESQQKNMYFEKLETSKKRKLRLVRLTEVGWTSDELKSFARTQTNLHKKTTHTLLLVKNDKVKKRSGS